MRLPWPFGRTERTEVASPAPVDFDGSVRPAPARRDWASLPPIQRTVTEAPLVAPTTRFQADAVAGAHALPPILEPLGHEVDAAAPPGIVAATPVVVPALTATRPLVDRPVQRRNRAPSPTARGLDTAADAGPSGSPFPLEAPIDPPSTGAGQAAPVEPVRRLDIVPANRPTALPERPLTRAPISTPPVRPSVSRAASAGVPSTDHTVGTAPNLPPVGRPRMRTAADRPASTPSEPAAAPRRAGLGAPMAAPPATATTPDAAPRTAPGSSLQRLPATLRPALAETGAPSARRGDQPTPELELPGRPRIRPVAQRPDLATGGPTWPAPSPSPGADGPAPFERGAPADRRERPVLPELPVIRTTAHPPVAGGESGAAAEARPAPAGGVQRTVSTAATGRGIPASASPVRPIIGRRPFNPTSAETAEARSPAGSSRAASSLDAVDRGPSAAGGLPRPTDAVAQRLSDAAPASLVSAMEPMTAGASLMPWQLASAGSSSSDVGPVLATSATKASVRHGYPGAPGVQRVAVRPAPAASTASASASALPLARPNPAPTGSSAGAVPDPATTQTIVFPGAARFGASSTSGPQVQRTVDAHASATAPGPIGPTVTPAVQRVEGGVAAPSDEGTGEQSEEELQRLAGALYGRLRAQLRSELIHEREARGLTFDNA